MFKLGPYFTKSCYSNKLFFTTFETEIHYLSIYVILIFVCNIYFENTKAINCYQKSFVSDVKSGGYFVLAKMI